MQINNFENDLVCGNILPMRKRHLESCRGNREMSTLRVLGWITALCACASAWAAPPSTGAASSDPRAIRFAAEDWPPFVSPALPGDGLSGSMVRAAFERAGYRLKIDYFPWKRTMQFGLKHPQYAGFMAVWRTAEREQLCHFSSPIGNTLTVLAYLKDAPPQVASLADLKGTTIGTVAGYSNGEQFDAMVRRAELTVEEGVNDDINLKKLLIKRFRMIVIEKHVLRHHLASSHFGKAERARIGIIDNLFKERPVYLCFKRTAEGLVQQKRFNEAAKDIDLLRLERDYWKRSGDEAQAGGE